MIRKGVVILKIVAKIKEKSGLNFIKKGAIDYYCAFKINTNIKYDKLCAKIQKCICDITTAYETACAESMLYDMEGNIKNIGEGLEVKIDGVALEKKKKINYSPPELGYNPKISVDFSDNKAKIYLLTDATEKYHEQNEMLEFESEFNSKIYGQYYVESQQRFILPPFEIELNNGEYVCTESALYLFENKMCILMMSLPLKNVSSTPLMINDFKQYITSIRNNFQIPNFHNKNSIDDIKVAYLNLLTNIKGVNSLFVISGFQNIILCDYNGMPDYVSELNATTMVDLYKIVSAPIQDLPSRVLEKQAKKHICNNSCNDTGIKYIVSSMGKFVSIVDKKILEHKKKEIVLKCNDVDNIELIETDLLNMVLNSVRTNAEFSFIILLLKRLNTLSSFHKKAYTKDILKSQEEFNRNKIFISELQNNCYGTVKVQLEQFENLIPHFMNKSITEENINAIESIVNGEENARKESLQNLMAIGGFLLTGIIGLPAIYDTVTVLRDSNLIIDTDLPIITKVNFSILLWIIMMIIMIVPIIIKTLPKARIKLILKNIKTKIQLYKINKQNN